MRVLVSGRDLASCHMQQDALFLEQSDGPILHFYEFLPGSVTYGHFINPLDWLKSEPADGARRPTGGGLIFHEGDFSFTFVLPQEHPFTKLRPLERYVHINSLVKEAVRALVPTSRLSLQDITKEEGAIDQLCMANPSPYDLLAAGKKIGGCAQRKNRHALIHQCSLFLLPPPWEQIGSLLLHAEEVVPRLAAFTGSLFQSKDQIPQNFRLLLQAELEKKLRTITTFR